MRKGSITVLFALLLSGGATTFEAAAAPFLSVYKGIVQTRQSAAEPWIIVKFVPVNLKEGGSVRTGSRSNATVVFDDGSRVELGESGAFNLENANSGKTKVELLIGKLFASVEKLGYRRFSVRTPTAVCSVRGTQFHVDVAASGHTTVDLHRGLLGVEDKRGQQILLQPNQRVEIGLNGMNNPVTLPSQAQRSKSRFHKVMRREMTLDMSKEEVQSAAAREIKMAEFQQGKAMTDVHGNRVRIEEYIVRPEGRDDQFKLVVLNERKNRFDYFYYLGTFNRNLPKDLRVPLRQLHGTVGSAAEYYLTAFETGRSNTDDSMVELARGGHPVDLNNNADPADNVASFFNVDTDRYEDVTGRKVFRTIFDDYGFYINGTLKYGWSGANIQSYTDVVAATNTDPITGAALGRVLPARSVSATFPDGEKIHQVIYESYSDGTFTRWDNYIVDDEGKIAGISDFQGTTSGSSFKEKLLNFNYEQVITASEFDGRSIDLVVAPRILVQSGLIQ